MIKVDYWTEEQVNTTRLMCKVANLKLFIQKKVIGRLVAEESTRPVNLPLF